MTVRPAPVRLCRVADDDGRERAEQLDAADALAGFRERFEFIDPALVYLDGNSLGRLPVTTAGRIATVVEQEWGDGLIRSWSAGWMDRPLHVGDRLGAALLGAGPGETVVCDSTTVNLFKVLSCAMDLRPDRRTVLASRGEFPTDRYIASQVAANHGGSVRWLGPLDPAATWPTEPVDAAELSMSLSDDTALLLLSVVDYRSAALADIAAITAVVHDVGALVIWDCSHAVGSVPLELRGAGADFAVGCSYKFVNGGPGAPAWIWAHPRHHHTMTTPIPGWMGHADVFAMTGDYVPGPGIRRFMSGTPSPVALAAVEAGVELVAEAGIGAVREKGMALTEYVMELADLWLRKHGVLVASPRDSRRRGAHVALRHPDAQELSRALIERGVIVDFRHPNGIRIGLSPLTTSFTDVHVGLTALRSLL